MTAIAQIRATSSVWLNCLAAASRRDRGLPVGDHGDGFAQGQRRSFGLGGERRLAPSVERVDALLGLPGNPSVFGVHIKAEGAPVDLGGADL